MFGKRNQNTAHPTEGKSPRKKRSFFGVFFKLFFLILILLSAGLFYFISLIPINEQEKTPQADGIVVLTGGAKRIEKAVWLISNTQAEKLLISGVNLATKAKEIKALDNISDNFISCCITLDYEARNTIENANETHLWAKEHNMSSLIIVTSNYHMPRSLSEMKRASPDIKFIPYPVSDKKVQIEKWWEYPGTRRLLIGEYFKYIASLARMGLVKLGVQASLVTDGPGAK